MKRRQQGVIEWGIVAIVAIFVSLVGLHKAATDKTAEAPKAEQVAEVQK